MLNSPQGAQLLHGLSPSEAFHRFVLNDPDVTALATPLIEINRSYECIFREGQFPGPYIEFAWPLDITAEDLAFEFVRPAVFFSNVPLPEASIEVKRLCVPLVERLVAIRNLLRSGKVIARGTYVRTGEIKEVHRLQWSRRELQIDVQNSDLIETENYKSAVSWSGLILEASTPAAANPPTPAETKAASKGVNTTHRASIKAAILANWPEGIPKGIPVQKRDQIINDWQRDNGQAVTSSRTIRKHIAGD
jgi:hypothetical protein